MGIIELEKIVVAPIIFHDGHKIPDPLAQPGWEAEWEVEYDNKRHAGHGIVSIVKPQYGNWVYFVDGAPVFLLGQSILRTTPHESHSAIKVGGKYDVYIPCNGGQRQATASVVALFSLDSHAPVYLRVDGLGDLCSARADILSAAKPLE